MKPIVLLGGGEIHYRLIQALTEAQKPRAPIILVADRQKVFPKSYVPLAVGGLLNKDNCQLDLWSVCQRTGIYFLEDQCLDINFEDQVVYLKKYGKLQYEKVSVETKCMPQNFGLGGDEKSSIFIPETPERFLNLMGRFFQEVHKHCPKEIRVIFSGLSRSSLDLAYFTNKELSRSCERIDIVIIEQHKKLQKQVAKVKKALGKHHTRVVFSEAITKVFQHSLELTQNQKLDFDIFIPFDQWRSKDFIGQRLETRGQKIAVHSDLSYSRDPSTFVVGENVYLQDQELEINRLPIKNVAQTLLHNILSDEENQRLNCPLKLEPLFQRPYLKTSGFFNFANRNIENKWQETTRQEINRIQHRPVFESARREVEAGLEYEARHMSRPWQGLGMKTDKGSRSTYRLISFNGFNNWGGYTVSANKICEIAILKALTQGITPSHLRFNLSLPRSQAHLTQHIFESTFRAIEEVTENHGLEIDGGDTFDGDYWHLNITIGGQAKSASQKQFRAHDYLLVTRPLGFGLLWTSRLQEHFDSSWVQKSLNCRILPSFSNWSDFMEKYQPSGCVLNEEWGFLYHCLQALPAHQQLLINFREIPRFSGINKFVKFPIKHPGLDPNWQRIKDDVAFDRSEISFNNSILWDPLSQGGVVVGVRASSYKQALKDLRDMGYSQAALVGSIRPKSSDNRVVLSDWIPQ